jgi:hypothetical protein
MDTYICDNGYVKIIFKYEDYYKEAIEFIKNKNVLKMIKAIDIGNV